ncbi:MAG: nucleoside hydrolase [Pseudomonadota bacterium]
MTQHAVIDCDPGIDDALALLLAAGSPELVLDGVTCVAGNRPVEITAQNAARLLALAGLSSVPVYAGCERPMGQKQARCNLVHGEDGLGGVSLAPGMPLQNLHAVEFLAARLAALQPPLTLIALGPLTNLALVETLWPGSLRRAESLLIMGGAFFCPGNVTPAAEFNFFSDPIAARIVLESGARMVFFGLDVTSLAEMPASWVESFAALEGNSGQAVLAMLRSYALQDPLLHDVCPVAYALVPELFKTVSASVSVNIEEGPQQGKCSSSIGQGSQNSGLELALGVDAPGLLRLVRERISALP